MSHTARRTAVVTLVAGGIVVLALALWKLRLVVGLLFAAAIIAAAMRPGVEWLYRRRVPRVAGVLLHYVALVALVAAALWLIVPRALDQVDTALSPGGKQHIARVAAHSHGIKHDILTALQSRLQHLPKASHFIGPAASAGKKAVEIGIASSSRSPRRRTGSSNATGSSTSSPASCRDPSARWCATPGS